MSRIDIRFLAQAYEPFYICFLVMCLVITIELCRILGFKIGNQSEIRTFRAIMWGYILYIAEDFVWVIFSYHAQHPLFLKVLEAAQVAIVTVFTFLWFSFAEVYMEGFVYRYRLARRIITVPVLLGLAVSAYFAIQQVRTFYLEGVFMNTDLLYSITFGLDCFYMFFALAHSLIKRFTTESGDMRRKCRTISECVVFPAAGAFGTLFVPYTPLLIIGILPSIVKVIIETQNSYIYTDALTGMNNRERVYDLLSRRWIECSPEKPIVIYMMDINDFKGINDRYGHLEGDHALVIVADILKQISRHGMLVGRFGGDEFILCDRTGMDPKLLSSDIKNSLAEKSRVLGLQYPLSISIGFCSCTDPDHTITEIQKKADEGCYKDKMKYYELTRRIGVR